ncbi:MAG: CRTAC1 family protein [Thermoanaerobaculia bacterium]|nr:CRTAC1 family protein [Thermoanaerobaculia bacterium]
MPRSYRFSAAVLLVASILASACGREASLPPVASSPPGAGEGPATFTTPAPKTTVPLLVEVTDRSGVDFRHHAGAAGEQLFPEMMGGGVAVFDANQDGRLDLYFASGAPDLGRSRRSSGTGRVVNRLYIQQDDGRFADGTEGSGLDDAGYGTGLAVGDVNNDGLEDVFVANFGPDRLYLGRGEGRFEEVSEASGIAATGVAEDDWSTSAAFCDVNRDGYLDLYVVRYVVFDPAVHCTDKTGRKEYCGPDSFTDRVDVLLLNRGDGTFLDATTAAGIDEVTGAGLGVVCADLDDNGWVDIYVANDGDPNQLWMNQGAQPDGSVAFVDEALILGTSVNASGLEEAGMGVLAADFDSDADLDLFLTHLRDETNTFYRNLGPSRGFQDDSTGAGLAASSAPYTGFGTAALDLDLDGDLDLVVANGRVLRAQALTEELPAPWNQYAEPNLVYGNQKGVFGLLGNEVLSFTEPVEIGRGLATGDLDGDGTVDLILNNLESKARIYHGSSSGHWLLVDVVDPRLNRRALGAQVTLSGDGRRQLRTVQGAMSYLSSSDPRAHFGLGDFGQPVTLEVRWPDGLEETFTEVAVDQAIVLERGQGEP